jgi:histidinol-phosphate aminotransferase
MSDPELRIRISGRSDLTDLRPYRAPQLDAPVKLNTNESPYPPPETFIKELAQAVSSLPLNRYPSRDFVEARRALAGYLGTLTDRVWMANGSNEVILQLLLAFGGTDRKVMTFEPTYTMHAQITRISGTRHMRARRNPDYSLHPEATIQAIELYRPDIVFLCSPNNPTGNSDSEEILAQVCRATQGLVILDQAYVEFSNANHSKLIEEHENLVVTRTFSKAWRLAGARIGYLMAPPNVLEEIQKVRLPYGFSALSQAVVMTAMNHVGEMLATVEAIRYERQRLYRELSTTKGITAFPSEANFILFRCDSKPAEEVFNSLLARGVLVRDFSDISGCEGCLRVTVGTMEQDERFLEALHGIMYPK